MLMDSNMDVTDMASRRWFIDLGWYEENARSFVSLAKGCLCYEHRRLWEDGGLAADDFLATIRDCCSAAEGFITANTPILETVFRLLLSRGNEPLTLGELVDMVREHHGGGYAASPGALNRLLAEDRFYGFAPSGD